MITTSNSSICSLCHSEWSEESVTISSEVRNEKSQRCFAPLNMTESETLEIQRQLLWVLDAFFHFNQKRHGFLAINRAMIVTEREIHHRAHFHFAIDRDCTRHNFVHTENSALGLIHNGRAQERAVNAAV